jgi:hypothetical protein
VLFYIGVLCGLWAVPQNNWTGESDDGIEGARRSRPRGARTGRTLRERTTEVNDMLLLKTASS